MTTRKYLIVDAGSSGSRLFQYEWMQPVIRPEPTMAPSYPNWDDILTIRLKATATTDDFNSAGAQPQLDPALAKQNLNNIPAYFDRLISKIPVVDADRQSFQLVVMGTGGMRKLTGAPRQQLEDRINTYLAASNFAVSSYRTITGEDEALYGWVGANYLLEHLGAPGIRAGERVGYLEMGGESAQIAYTPTDGEFQATPGQHRITRVALWGERHDLHLKSFPVGGKAAWDQHQKSIPHIAIDAGRRFDPCRPVGWDEGSNQVAGAPRTIGNCDYDTCEYLSHLILRDLHGAIVPDEDEYPNEAPPEPAPARDGWPVTNLLSDSPWNQQTPGRQFVGGAHFWYTTRLTFGRDPWGHAKQQPFSSADFERAVRTNSRCTWDSLIPWYTSETDPTKLRFAKGFLEKAWFMAAWVSTVLHTGFGFDRGGETVKFQPFDGPVRGRNDDRPGLSWTVGVAFIEAAEAARGVEGGAVEPVLRGLSREYINGAFVETAI